MKATFEALKDRPCAGTIHKRVDKMTEEVRQRECSNCCSNVATAAIPGFTALFAKLVDELVSEVRFVVHSRITIMMGVHRSSFLCGIDLGHHEYMPKSCFTSPVAQVYCKGMKSVNQWVYNINVSTVRGGLQRGKQARIGLIHF